MRRLSAGNKTRFTVFTIIVISIIIVLVVFLSKALAFEKEEYEVTKDVSIYDNNYEYINLTRDAVITKKWTGRYYLNEPETGLSYDLGRSTVAYDSIKNRINLYGTFYDVAIDGEVTKTERNTEITNMLNSKLFKIEDRKYLLVSKNITTENSSLTAENYLIIVIDKSGNTLLLNDNMDVKTINAIVLQTDTFKFDVANEKLINNDVNIDLTKIIGSTNEYVPPKKVSEEQNSGTDNNAEQTQSGGTSVNVGGSIANSSNNSGAVAGGSSVVNSANDSNNEGGSNNSSSNLTKVIKSVSLRSVNPGKTYLDVNYLITDPENKYQVVYLTINGGDIKDDITISLDKTKDFYRIPRLKPNTEYSITLGYKEIKNDATIEQVTEDILNVRTLKLGGDLAITKVSLDNIYYNVKLDINSSYSDAEIEIYINGVKTDKNIKVDTSAILNSGWSSSVDITEAMRGKNVTLKLKNVKDVDLSASVKIDS